jgi:hypothetical protein
VKNPWTGKDPDRGLIRLEGPLETVLEQVTEGRLAGFEMIKSVWPEIVSAAWHDRSRPVRFEKGVLTIEVSDGGAASRLRLEQRKIRAALDERLGHGEVVQIRMRVGRRKDWPNRS